jgi:hypothetical protein
MTAGADGAWIAAPGPTHAECEMLDHLGHDFGVCSCTGYDRSHASAVALWNIVSQRRGRDLAVRDDETPSPPGGPA